MFPIPNCSGLRRMPGALTSGAGSETIPVSRFGMLAMIFVLLRKSFSSVKAI
jgi:hypothetical protein